MTRLVLASTNAGKLREIGPLLAPLGWDVRPQSEWSFEDAVEDGHTFIENALIKARHASDQTGLAALADDSGLVVDALDGALAFYLHAMPGMATVRPISSSYLMIWMAYLRNGALRISIVSWCSCVMRTTRRPWSPAAVGKGISPLPQAGAAVSVTILCFSSRIEKSLLRNCLRRSKTSSVIEGRLWQVCCRC